MDSGIPTLYLGLPAAAAGPTAVSAAASDTNHSVRLAVAVYFAVKCISNRSITVKVIILLLYSFTLPLRVYQCSCSAF